MIEVMPAQNHWECSPVLISYSSKVCQCFHATLCWPKMWNGEATWPCMDLLCVASCPMATQSETAGASWWRIWHRGKLVGRDSWGCAKWRKSGGWLIITPDGTRKKKHGSSLFWQIISSNSIRVIAYVGWLSVSFHGSWMVILFLTTTNTLFLSVQSSVWRWLHSGCQQHGWGHTYYG